MDVLIIGSGGAGCSAAIEAWQLTKNILLITKTDLLSSKTARAQGGIQAALTKSDSPQLHFEDTMQAGNFKNNPVLVRLMTQHAKETICWLENVGIQFDKKENGEYKLKKAAGISEPRVLSCGDDSGNRIMKPLLSHVKSFQIPIWTDSAALEIKRVKNDFGIKLSRNGKIKIIKARTIVLATGGVNPREKKIGLGQRIESDPDGVDLARGLNAEIIFPELMQFHPTGIIQPSEIRRLRLPETMRGDGARILNKELKEFCDPLSTRKILCSKIVDECEKGFGVRTQDGFAGVWMMTPDIDIKNGAGYTSNNYNKFYAKFLSLGHDITKKPVLVYPIVHYSLGGVKINEIAESSVNGLFVAGETAYGVHGEDRLMGNSLLDIFVFGRIAGKNAALKALEYNNEK